MLTKEMLETAIYEHGQRDYIRVKESNKGIVMEIDYETPDCTLFHTISEILGDVELDNDLGSGFLDSGKVDFSEKGVIRITFGEKIKFYEPIKEISLSARDNAVKVLIDNGIEEDEAETVLQAVGYVLLDKELFPEDIVM